LRRWIALGIVALALGGWAAASASARTLHYYVTVSVSGPGHVTGSGDGGSIDCPDNCEALIKQQTYITLTATPDGDAQFTGWGGDCADSGTNDTCEFIVSGPKTVTAGFGTPPPPVSTFTLTVAKAGTGTGYVGGAGGIDCGPTCAAALQQGATIKILAIADDGSEFAGWSGGGCSGTEPCTVTIDSDTTVTATFDRVDRAPPLIRTLRGSAKPGTTASLRYRVWDDSGKSREVLTIVEGKVPIGRVVVPLGPVDYRRVYTAHWRVPAGLKPGERLFCAVATDPTGNVGKRSCSAFTVA